MILLREIQKKDLSALETFANIPGFINLPNDRDLLRQKIDRSMDSFSGKIKDKGHGKYIFIAEELETGRVVGTSMIAAQHGTQDSPHFYFQVGTEQKFSETISTGFIHGTLKLMYDTDGPSEIGGLIIDPDFRNTSDRVGRQISFIRFLYLGLNKDKFKNKIIAELLPPLNKRGQSPLWEAVGRRFTNMDYTEADRLCQANKEFIFSLFPTGKIYTTFLPAEARNAIGKVGKATEPVFHMLTKIGFKYQSQVDPFDGGPHLWVDVKDLGPLKKMAEHTYDPSIRGKGPAETGLICKSEQSPGQFRAVSAEAIRSDGKLAFVDSGVADRVQTALQLKPGERVVFMSYY